MGGIDYIIICFRSKWHTFSIWPVIWREDHLRDSRKVWWCSVGSDFTFQLDTGPAVSSSRPSPSPATISHLPRFWPLPVLIKSWHAPSVLLALFLLQVVKMRNNFHPIYFPLTDSRVFFPPHWSMCLKPVQKVQIGKCFSSPSPPSPSSISDASHQNGYLWTKSQKCREASQNVIHERLIDLFLLGHGCSGSVWKAVPPFLLLVFVYECVYSDVHGSHLQIFIILFFIDFFLYWKYLIRS